MSEFHTEHIAQELTHDGTVMVVVSIKYPVISGIPQKAKKRINMFYAHHAKSLLRRIKKSILPSAVLDYLQSLERSVPFRPYEAALSYSVTYNGGDILSLYREFSLRSGNSRSIVRLGDTWSAVSGWFVELSSFFPPGANYKKLLIKNAAETAAKQEKSGTHRYYENYRKLLKKCFSRDNFYITDTGVVIFYDELSIAPRSEGIPVFIYDTGMQEALALNSSMHPA